ncbi:MAG: hypothetical protein IPQ07_37465 [Myxococcales bacterium]|nr:hypothetical protein [Myxococcales bacterium]
MIDVTCRDNATLPVLAKAPFAPTVLSTDRRWYKGDFHVHSEQSGDADAKLLAISALARSRGPDFVNLSDHNTSSQHAPIAALRPMFPELPVPARRRDHDLRRARQLGGYQRVYRSPDRSSGARDRHRARRVQAQGGAFIVNHPTLDLGGACIGCAWRHPDTDWSKVNGLG